MDLLQNFYELTLESLKDAKNERLWFKTNTKLASLYLQSQDWVKLQYVLKVNIFLAFYLKKNLFYHLKKKSFAHFI